MTSFKKLYGALVILISLALGAGLMAQDRPAAKIERFAGTTELGSQPGIPVHVELRRSGHGVEGTISIPGAVFELVDARGGDTITGRFRGNGGEGALSLNLAGEELSGTFQFQGQPGRITARRTTESAEVFFRAPTEKLDLTSKQWLEDLDRLGDILTKEHASPYHRVTQQQFENDVAWLRTAIPVLNGREIALEFRRLAASIGDGHTSVALPSGMTRLPIEFYWFEDGLRVVAVSDTEAEVRGARLVAVNDMPVAEVTERLRAFVPQDETQFYHRAGVAKVLNSPDILRAIGMSKSAPIAFTLETTDGREKRLEMITAAGIEHPAILGGNPPLWQQHRELGFWSKWLDDDTVYVNWRSYDDLTDQGAALLQSVEEKRPGRLIIDLRDNSGGDFNLGRAFIEEIRERPWLNRKGVLYVMIGRRTFSAAMTNAIDFKQKTEALLVGEPAGAAPNNWQEVRRFHLPNSGLRVGVSTRFYTFMPGKEELRPDHVVPPVPRDWGKDVDAAVSFILAQPTL